VRIIEVHVPLRLTGARPGRTSVAGFPDLTDFLPFLAKVWAHPSPPPARFDYRLAAPSFSVWGWSFCSDVSVSEFTYLTGVSRTGLTATGSGELAVTTARLYRPGSRWPVKKAGQSTRITASPKGQLTFTVDLGAPRTTQQSDVWVRRGPAERWTTMSVAITKA
jgi:hypothetical protein